MARVDQVLSPSLATSFDVNWIKILGIRRQKFDEECFKVKDCIMAVNTVTNISSPFL